MRNSEKKAQKERERERERIIERRSRKETWEREKERKEKRRVMWPERVNDKLETGGARNRHAATSRFMVQMTLPIRMLHHPFALLSAP